MQGAALQIHTAEPARRAARLQGVILPLALYAALALAFASILGVELYAPALLAGAAVAAIMAFAPPRWGRVLLLVSLVLSLGAMAFSSARDGAAVLANRLFDASEAVNAYAYEYFSVAEAASPRAALPWLALFGGALCAFAARRRINALTLFFAIAFAEAYFGVTPPAWQNILLFALLALLLLREDAISPNGAALLAGAAAVALAVFLLAPRPNAAVEAYSEHLRDELGTLAFSAAQPAAQPETENAPVHQESRQHEEAANADDAGETGRQEYERQTENEQEISLPRRIDFLRIVLLLLAIVALLVVPFLPFLLLNRAKRLAAERRAAFGDADNAAAIRAMFTHTMRWLRAAGLQTENRPFAQCEEAVRQMMSDEYAAQYAEGAAIWQEAAYSEHAMDDGQRAAIRALLDRTEATLYKQADRRTRLRLKYKDCLCEV
ncbi:MAG: hypothetical protein E7474_10400 [Ruminococcaceae bacterium]|nr:hypothetical protein [Oscillospiraceae bacterium]